jgi:hypothetical protein
MGLKATGREHEEARTYLRAQLSKPKEEVDLWLNGIVDSWIASRHPKRARAKKKRG